MKFKVGDLVRFKSSEELRALGRPDEVCNCLAYNVFEVRLVDNEGYLCIKNIYYPTEFNKLSSGRWSDNNFTKQDKKQLKGRPKIETNTKLSEAKNVVVYTIEKYILDHHISKEDYRNLIEILTNHMNDLG